LAAAAAPVTSGDDAATTTTARSPDRALAAEARIALSLPHLPGIPAGTTGKVFRRRLRVDPLLGGGQRRERGSITRTVRPGEPTRRAAQLEAAAAELSATPASSDGGRAGSGGAGGGVSVGGVLIPSHLLD
jgi:hypothetical protein